jgi:radical SAM protein with 4Fe4S-binding SPASM domain
LWRKAGELKSKKLIQLVKNPKPDLRIISILLTLLCNARCKFCHIWGKKGWALKEPDEVIKEQINFEILCRFIEEAMVSEKKFEVLLTGGEPLLYSEFPRLLKFIKNKQLTSTVLTNGSLLKENSQIVAESVTSILVSLDGPPGVHDKIRCKKNLFYDACEGIKTLFEIKKQKKCILPLLGINYVISEYNSHCINEFVKAIKEQFESIGAKLTFDTRSSEPNAISVTFQPRLFTTEDMGKKYAMEMKNYFNCTVSPSWKGFIFDKSRLDSAKIKENLVEIWEKEGTDYSCFVDLEEYFGNINNVFGRTRCFSPWFGIRIRPNGEVYICRDLKDFSIGNIYESLFKEIWNGKRIFQFRNVLRNRLLSLCNRCCSLFLYY